MPPSSTWNAVNRLNQVLCPVTAKVQETTQIHSRSQSGNETLQEYILQFTHMVTHTPGADHTSVTCRVTIILL